MAFPRKLSDAQLAEITVRVLAGETKKKLAPEYGISRGSLSHWTKGIVCPKQPRQPRTPRVRKKPATPEIPVSTKFSGPISRDIDAIPPDKLWTIYLEFICGMRPAMIANVFKLSSGLAWRLCDGWESGALPMPKNPALGFEKRPA